MNNRLQLPRQAGACATQPRARCRPMAEGIGAVRGASNSLIQTGASIFHLWAWTSLSEAAAVINR